MKKINTQFSMKKKKKTIHKKKWQQVENVLKTKIFLHFTCFNL